MPNIEFTNSVSIPESFRMTPIGPPNVATPGKTTVGHCFSSGFSRAARILFSCVMTPVLSVCAQGQPGAPSTSPINFPSQPALELGERWNAESDKQATQIISTVEDLLKRRSVGKWMARRFLMNLELACSQRTYRTTLMHGCGSRTAIPMVLRALTLKKTFAE